MRLSIFLYLLMTTVGMTYAQVQPNHIVILVLENKAYREIYNDTSAPYLNSLIQNPRTALFTRSFALARPSQPNYIMLFSGSPQGVNSNNTPTNLPFLAPNLGASLLANSYSFAGYSEDLPYTGFTDSAFAYYKRKHNPWVNWQGNAANGIPVSANKPFTEFPTNYTALPTVSFVIPNELHDMHDGTVKMGDTWIQDNMDGYVQWCKNNNSLFVVTFDEDNNSGLDSNHIFTSITGGNIMGGLYDQPVTHYNVLRTIEQLLGLPYLGASADSSAFKNIWLTPLPVNMVDFSATRTGEKVVLKWEVLSDGNVENYAVEKSGNGRLFYPIGEKNGNGQYHSFIDEQPFPGMNHYRIKTHFVDNKTEYSKVVSTKMPGEESLFFFYPNPANSVINIQSRSAENKSIRVSLMDATGRLLKTVESTLSPSTPLRLNIKELAKGVYYLHLVNAGQSTIEKLLIE